MATKKTTGSIRWTGKNLAAVRAFHKDVAHYPEDPKAQAFTRDASQHPDNLHLEVDGRTLTVGIGDTITRDADGLLAVTRGGKAPRTLSPASLGGPTHDAEGNDTIKGKGGAR